jgi:hypothetical protein
MVNSQHFAWLPLVVTAMVLGCVTPAPPGKSEIPDGAIKSIAGGPVELRGNFGLKGRRVISQGVGSVSVDEDEYTTAVITRLAEQFREHGVRVESGADHVVEIQVVRITIHPKPQYTCVIDFNRRLGNGPVRGLQSRAERGWDARKACAAAASQVVIDILNDPATRDYLKGA